MTIFAAMLARICNLCRTYNQKKGLDSARPDWSYKFKRNNSPLVRICNPCRNYV